jgi:two-component system, chemotaxis family, protein-glutamate methylesterase/glutaminase
MIVIGASLGGLKALKSIVNKLPPSFPQPIAAALHRHKESDDALAEFIQTGTLLPVSEVVDKEPILPGHVYLAPADYHLFVERDYFSLSTDDLVQFARPSIDVLFESAADTFGPSVIGIVLTGANQDGSKGAIRIKDHGGRIIVQDPKSADCPIMPEATLHAVQADYVCMLEEIGPLLQKLATNPT